MYPDEQAIRKVVEDWMSASKAGDLKTVLSLMAEDAIFMVPGRQPFGKEQFIADSESMKGFEIDGKSDIQEIQVLGDWAWMRNYLKVTVKTPDGEVMRRSGYVLTVLKKTSDGEWVLFRDANLLTPEPG